MEEEKGEACKMHRGNEKDLDNL